MNLSPLHRASQEIGQALNIPSDHVEKVLVFLKFEQLDKRAGELKAVLDSPEGKSLFGLNAKNDVGRQFDPETVDIHTLRVAIRGNDALGAFGKDLVA